MIENTFTTNSVRLISCSWRRQRSENTRGWRGASEVWPGRAKEWVGRRKGNEHRAASNAARPPKRKGSRLFAVVPLQLLNVFL
jgi:hypothetical protein